MAAPMRMLIAVDGSDHAELAVDLIASAPWPSGSSVHSVEVVETGAALFGGPWPALAIAQAQSIEDELVSTARDRVAQTRERFAAAGLESSSAVLRGRPALAIVEAAAQMSADLIVVGSRGHGVIESMVLGSVSSEVVDHASIPVLVTRARTMDKVILAWDGSECARSAADLMRRWPALAGSAVRVVSVTEVQLPWWTGFPVVGSPVMLPLYADVVAASRHHHETLARDMAEELREAGLEAEADAREGDAAAEILAAARSAAADLIVLGTHGRTGLHRLLLGSVARNVLHHAHASVLIIPDPKRPG
jgi:nucleotide-binding universal stress UspA family protein